MGTEVLRPQDLLAERFHVSPAPFHRRRNFPGNGNLTKLIVNQKPNNNTYCKKTSPKPEKKRFSSAMEAKKQIDTPGKDDVTDGGVPVMGQVTLLKRGESLGGNLKVNYPDQKPIDDLAVCGIGRVWPDSPEVVPKQIRLQPST